MPRNPRMSSRERYLSKRMAGYIDLQIYNTQIPVFTSEKDCEEVCKYEGFDLPDLSSPATAYAGFGHDKNGCRMFYVMLPPDSKVSTWVHEASHLVDFVIEYIGLDPTINGTEARAYMLAHIFSSIEDIMLPLQKQLSIPEIVTAAPYNEKPV